MEKIFESENSGLKSVVPNYILKQFKCSVCWNYLTKAPIKRKNDKYICGRCPEDGIRDNMLEVFVKQFLYPCHFKDMGCTALLEWNSEELVRHDIACDFKRISCLIEGCPWSNSKSQLIEHVIGSHPQLVLNDVTHFVLDLAKDEKFSFVFESSERKYFVGKVRTDGDVVRCSVMYAENVANCNEYLFDVTFYKDDREVRYVNKKVQLYCETDVDDNETFNVSISDLNFHSEVINVRFALRMSPEYVDKRKRSELTLKDIECLICSGPMKNEITVLYCGHSFCTTCVNDLTICLICKWQRDDYEMNETQNYKLEEIAGKVTFNRATSNRTYNFKISRSKK